MDNNYGEEVFDMVCRIFNPHYKSTNPKGESNEQNKELRRRTVR